MSLPVTTEESIKSASRQENRLQISPSSMLSIATEISFSKPNSSTQKSDLFGALRHKRLNTSTSFFKQFQVRRNNEKGGGADFIKSNLPFFSFVYSSHLHLIVEMNIRSIYYLSSLYTCLYFWTLSHRI